MAKEIILKKEQEVNAVVEKIAKSKSVVAFDYQGLTVEAFMQLRRNLLKNGCEICVLKNNISRRAAQAQGFNTFAESLKGPKAIAFSYDDEVAAARELAEFAKENKQVILGAGVVDGKEVSVEEMNAIATLPSRDTLLTQLAAGMLGTLTQLAIGLNMLVEKDAE
jgi:large subunit ribosomal protein L10